MSRTSASQNRNDYFRFHGKFFHEAIQANDTQTLARYIFQKPHETNNSFQPEDCFLSHRGPDTKLDLVVPLARMMTKLYGHSYFVDCEPTNMLARAQAESTTHVIAQSIWACKIIVVFLSPSFHESEWCLRELYTALYRLQIDPSLKAVHIVYCDGSFETFKSKPAYSGLNLSTTWGTEFKDGTPLHEFASHQLHNLLYQLIQGSTNGIQSHGISLAEWRKVCRHRFGIPPKLKYFVGRKEELSEISTNLEHYSSAAITTSGVGGVGKSQAVISWAHQNLSRYSLVVWIRAEQELTLLQDLATFGEQELGLAFTDKEHLEQRARRTQQDFRNRSSSNSPSLIIFDNAESYSDLLESNWIPPPGSNCHSIVTTRDVAGCPKDAKVKVGPLDTQSSLAIVEYFLQRKLDDINEKQKVLEMLKSFDFLPLAIVSFAAFASRFGLADAITRIRQIMARPIYDRHTYQGKQRSSVDAVLRAQIESLNEGARTMLEYLSLLAAENVPTFHLLKSLFEKDGSGRDYHEAMEQLMDRAIVLLGASIDLVSTHRLFQYTTMCISSAHGKLQNQLDYVAKCMATLVEEGFDEAGNHDRKYMSDFLPHIDVLVGHKWPEETTTLACLLYWRGRTMSNEAQYAEAMKLFQRALTIYGIAFGKNHPDYAITLHNLASVYEKQGQNTKAMEIYEQALVIKGAILGKDDPSYAATLHNMAGVHDNQGRHTEAMELYKQALVIMDGALGKDHPEYATTLNSVAVMYSNQCKYSEAMKLYKQALAIKGSALGKDHPSFAITLHNMAIVQEKQGQYTKAMELYEQALAIYGSSFGEDHPSYAITLLGMASVHVEKVDLNTQALAIQSSALGRVHSSHDDTVHNMANMHDKQGLYTEAMDLYEQALAITDNVLGKDHPWYAATLHNMAIVHGREGRYTKALELYEQALVIKGAILGKDNPSYAATLLNMAIVHDRHSQHTKAMELYKQALAIKGSSGEDHPLNAAMLHAMSRVYDEQKGIDMTLAFCQKDPMIKFQHDNGLQRQAAAAAAATLSRSMMPMVSSSKAKRTNEHRLTLAPWCKVRMVRASCGIRPHAHHPHVGETDDGGIEMTYLH